MRPLLILLLILLGCGDDYEAVPKLTSLDARVSLEDAARCEVQRGLRGAFVIDVYHDRELDRGNLIVDQFFEPSGFQATDVQPVPSAWLTRGNPIEYIGCYDPFRSDQFVQLVVQGLDRHGDGTNALSTALALPRGTP